MWRREFISRSSVHSASLDLTTEANNELKWTRKSNVVAWRKPVIQNFPRTNSGKHEGSQSRYLMPSPHLNRIPAEYKSET